MFYFTYCVFNSPVHFECTNQKSMDTNIQIKLIYIQADNMLPRYAQSINGNVPSFNTNYGH